MWGLETTRLALGVCRTSLEQFEHHPVPASYACLDAQACAGQEKIWQKALGRFNVSATELQDWFAGPGFLAWQRMGNLQGWGGPLPQAYIEAQAGKVSHAHLPC